MICLTVNQRTVEREETIDWLDSLRLPALPIAPAQDPDKYPAKDKEGNILRDKNGNPIPAFPGKSPSYLDDRGSPHLILHTKYQNRLPNKFERDLWFANPQNGIGTLGGFNNIHFLDADIKQFNHSQEEIDAWFNGILQRCPDLARSYLQQSHSGGYHIAIKLPSKPGFTNWAELEGGKHRGELIGEGRFIVLAPTIGVSGKPYALLSEYVDPVEVSSLAEIGIFSTKKRRSENREVAPTDSVSRSVFASALNLAQLHSKATQQIFEGNPNTDDRSAALTAAIRDWLGWENWAQRHGLFVRGSALELAQIAGQNLGIDSDRVDRIFKSVDDPAHCQPSIYYGGEDKACWLRVRKIDRETYSAACPQAIRDEIEFEWRDRAQTSSQQRREEQSQSKQPTWDCLPSNNHQIGYWIRKELSIEDDSERIESLKARCDFDPNVQFVGEKITQKHSLAVFKLFVPKCDFDFSCEKVISGTESGLVLKIRRIEGTQLVEKEVCIRSSETTTIKEFVNALKREYRQNLACTLKPEELAALLQNRMAQYRSNGGKTYKLADRTGQQDDGTWIFENCQFKANGTPTTESESLWMFNHQLGETEKIPSPAIMAQCADALPNLAKACKDFFHSETLPLVWFTCGYSVATFQREEIMTREGNFPQLSLFGDPGGAKTTAAAVAVSLAGMHHKRCIITKFSESLIYEQVKSLGGLPLLLDDPIKKGKRQAESRDQLDNFLWSAYNGATRKVRGNEQTPHTNVIVTSNLSPGEGNQAVESRLIKLAFTVRIQNDAGFPALEEAMNGASGGLSQLLAIHYDRKAVKDIRSRLLEHLSGSHSRISSSYALLVYFTQKFCDVAGIEFDAFAYCVKYLCPTANELESDKDSLTDFLEKLSQMRAEGLVGDWNVTKVTSEFKTYLAVHLPSVWTEFERRFSPNYSRQSIEQIILGREGKKNSPQKFVATKLECVEFDRAMAATKRGQGDMGTPMRPTKGTLRKAILIPESELPLANLNDNEAIEAFSTYEGDILEDDHEQEIEDSKSESVAAEMSKTESKESHPHHSRISGWVRRAGLTKQESIAIRKQIFGDRWKKWRYYTETEMLQLEAEIQRFSATRQIATQAANADDGWR
jgi:hypothetical protein